MLASDVISLARRYVNDPTTTGRWTDSSLMDFLGEAQQELIRDVQFPRCRLTATTLVNQQEYNTPELINVYRVYLAGQLLVPTTKQVLEGHQSRRYDQGFGTGIPEPGTQTPGSGGPPGTEGSYTPAWNIQVPASYPVTNAWGSPTPDAQGWFVNQRPRYYWESGVIGFVPAPASAVTICIDCLAVPPPVTTTTQTLIFPSNFRRALAWYIVMQCRSSDDTPQSAAKVQEAVGLYDRAMRKLRTDYTFYDGDSPRGPKLFTYRGMYQKGMNRNSSPNSEYP